MTYTEEELTPNYIVWVGGQGMYASTDGTVVTYYTNGADGAAGTVSETEPDVWNAKLYYDAANSVYTLEINGLDATGIADDADSIGAGIYSTVPLTIDMTGENHVTGDVYNYRAHGVYVAGALTFQGTGSLEAKAKDSLSYAYSRSIGVYTTGLLSVNGGTLTAAAGQAKGVSSGVFVYQFTMNGGTLSTSSASSEAGVSAAKSEGIYSYKDITINGGTICAVSGYGSVASHGIASDHNIMINDGTISAVAGDSNEDQSRGIYAFGVLTIIDGTVTGVAGSSKQDFSEGVGGAKGVVILGGEVEATGGDNSLVSIGLCSDADMTIGEDAVIRASAGSARKYSYGTFVMDDFHMSGEAFLQTYSDKTTDEPTDAKIPRSIGLYCGATSSTDPDDMDPYDEPATPVVDDTFTITGGTLEAWCTTSPDSTSTENYAVKMFDVVNDDFIFSDTAQPNDTWYKWTLETDDTGAPVNMIWSTKTQYVHADDKENYKSTYLYITPMEEIHEVTFDSMGGSEITPNPIEVENGAKVAKPADPTKANHSFLGWFTSEDNGVTFSEKAYEFDTPVVSDFTLYAQWVKQYTVKYELNGGTGAEGVDYTTQTVDEGTEITVKEDPSKKDNRFFGWYDGKDYYMLNGEDKITVTGNITLTAKWVPLFTVTLDCNDPTNELVWAIENILEDETANQTLSRQLGREDPVDAGEYFEPSRTGYTFGGWYTDKGVWENEYDFDSKVTADITVYAKWTANSYTVRFNANGGKGTMADQSFTYDVAQNLTSNDFTRDGYTFIGWAENESGDVKYTDGQSVKNLTYAKDGTVDLYAKWEEAAPPVVDPPVIDPPVVISGTASLTKVDAEDPATVLSGVVFELHRLDGALMGTYTTNAYGQITVYGLVPGTYYWRETRPAEGYVLDGTERVFTVYAGQTSSLVVENERSGVPGVFSGDHYAYVIGYDDGMVHPEANITRAEVATIFFRLLDEETRARYMTRSNSFSDVEEGMWFNTAVSTMAAMGIVTGRPDGTFDPNANITRAEFAAIAARFDANGNTTDASFTDIYGHWAMKEINIAANNGWVLGYEDGSFRPNQLITRAEAMTMVNRVLQRIPEHPEDLLDHMVTWPDNMDTSKWYYLMVQEATNSHDYHRKGNGYEYWTGLRQVPDWAALEN